MNSTDTTRAQPARLWRDAFAAAIVPLAFLLATSMAALDFGPYWDDDAMFTKVRRALASPPTLLPHAYDYPSVTFWMSVAALAPEAARDPALRARVPDTTQLSAFTESPRFLLRARAIFAAVSAFAVLWIAAATLALGGARWEAFLACALFATSWEIGYHVRWIAPDGTTLQFAAAATTAAVVAVTAGARHARRWCAAAAVATGLAIGTKYSAWPLIAPLSAAVWQAAPELERPRRLLRVIAHVAGAAGVFLLTSPGILLQPTIAAAQILGQVAHYANGHGIYTVSRGVDHLGRMLAYELTVLMSPYRAVAIGTTAAALVGAIAVVRRSSPAAITFVSFPIAFTLYFALQRAMIVRNLIVIAPFLAVLAGRGIGFAWHRTGEDRPGAWVRGALAAGVFAAIAANAAYAVDAAGSIRHRSDARTAQEFAAWLAGQPPGSVALSPRLQAAVGEEAPGRMTPDPGVRMVAMYALEPGHERITPNERGLFAQVFGPRDVNLNYYPDWVGAEHIVVLERRRAQRFQLFGP
jgi:hypothetical protein